MKQCIAVLLLLCGIARAESPTVGLWEQLYVYGHNVGADQHRINLVFANKPAAGMVFSAITDAGTKVRILCCVRTQTTKYMTLPDVFAKYKLARDDIDHLKTISGLKYIYEAKVVDKSDQNRNMRDLIDSTSSPDDQSPYSSAIISGDLRSLELTEKDFQVDGHAVTFNSTFDSGRGATFYKFNVDGRRVIFTESAFPD
jgi:hypothetical protein